MFLLLNKEQDEVARRLDLQPQMRLFFIDGERLHEK